MATFTTAYLSDNKAACVGYVPFPGYGKEGGAAFVHLAGAENIVSAMVAHILASDTRGNSGHSQLYIVSRGSRETVYLRKYTRYKILRERLDNANVSVVLIHPDIAQSAVIDDGFYIISHDTEMSGVPAQFFPRLNASLSIPLHEDWAEWLYTECRKPQTVYATNYFGESVSSEITLVHETESHGSIAALHVNTANEKAWLSIVRDKLALWNPVSKVDSTFYTCDICDIVNLGDGWAVISDGKPVVSGETTASAAAIRGNDEHGLSIDLNTIIGESHHG
jgi:hypothetical protein